MKTILTLIALLGFGTLAYGQPQEKVVNSYGTIPNLIQLNPNTPNNSVEVDGLATAGDGQGGLFAYSPTSNVSTNSTNVFATAFPGATGQWLRYWGTPGYSLTPDGTIFSNTVQSVKSLGGAFSLPLVLQTAHTFLGGPTSGSAAAPTFLSAANVKVSLGIQVGTATTAGDGSVTNTFVTAFASAPIVVTTPVNATAAATNTVTSVTASNFVVNIGVQSKVVNWIAIGAP